MKTKFYLLSLIVFLFFGLNANAENPKNSKFQKKIETKHKTSEESKEIDSQIKGQKGLVSKPGNSEDYYWSFPTEFSEYYGRIWNFIGPNAGAWDLINDTEMFSADADEEKDLVNTTTLADTVNDYLFSAGWEAYSTTMFVPVSSDFFYNAYSLDQIVEEYENGTEVSEISDVVEGDAFIAKLRDESYALVYVSYVEQTMDNNEDYIDFYYRKGYTFIGEGGEWYYNNNTSYTYDDSGRLLERLQTDATSGENAGKYTWEYDSHDNLVEYAYYYYWNGWVQAGGEKYIYSYDENDNITEEITQYYYSDSWQNESKETYVYDGNKLIERSNQYYEDGNWINNYKAFYTLDENGFVIEEVEQDWQEGSWVNNWKQTYGVNSAGEWTELIEYSWDNENWLGEYKYTDIIWHNWSDLDVQNYVEWIWVEDDWQSAARYSRTYTGNNYVAISEIYQAGAWVNAFRETFTETATEHVWIQEDYADGNWMYDYKGTDFYDDHNNYTGNRDENWEDGQWVVNYEDKYLFTYNDNGDITEEIHQYWSWDTQTLMNDSKYVYSNFQYFSGTDEILNSLKEISLSAYPNPVKDILNIDIQEADFSNAVVQIISISGQLVYENKISSINSSIDLSFLNTGIYVLRIYDENHNSTKQKLIKR